MSIYIHRLTLQKSIVCIELPIINNDQDADVAAFFDVSPAGDTNSSAEQSSNINAESSPNDASTTFVILIIFYSSF